MKQLLYGKLYGVKVLAVQADVNSNPESEQSVKNVVAKAVKEFGRIDVLINNEERQVYVVI